MSEYSCKASRNCNKSIPRNTPIINYTAVQNTKDQEENFINKPIETPIAPETLPEDKKVECQSSQDLKKLCVDKDYD